MIVKTDNSYKSASQAIGAGAAPVGRFKLEEQGTGIGRPRIYQ